MYLCNRPLYTRSNPANATYSGQPLEQGHPDARFLLIGKGAVVNEREARRLGVLGHDAMTIYDPLQARAVREQAARESYRPEHVFTITKPAPVIPVVPEPAEPEVVARTAVMKKYRA